MNLQILSNDEFLNRFSCAVRNERKITAEIIEYVKEMDRRQLYLSMGLTSLFQFMTERLGYTPGSAQRRIDSARMLREVPDLKEKLESGAINLMQVSTLARAVREKEKTTSVSTEKKREILATIEALDVSKSEVKIAQMLDVPVRAKETRRIQADESVRLEMTLTKEQIELLNQVKSLISHTHMNPTMAEVFEYLAKRFVQKKLGKIKPIGKAVGNKTGLSAVPPSVTATVAVIPPACEWHTDGKVCGSRFQVQQDHVQPRWAGGDGSPENMQWLCGVHNRMRYRQQANIKRKV